jgi:hypothetical protein
MAADCQACEGPAAVRPEHRPGRTRPWLTVLSTLGVVLAPKCPFCLVGVWSLFGATFGVSLGAASVVVAVLRPLAIGLALLSLVVSLVSRWRRARPRHG